MVTNVLPPTRKSTSARGQLKPVGPHQARIRAGSHHALQAPVGGTSNSRVTTTEPRVEASVDMPCRPILRPELIGPYVPAADLAMVRRPQVQPMHRGPVQPHPRCACPRPPGLSHSANHDR